MFGLRCHRDKMIRKSYFGISDILRTPHFEVVKHLTKIFTLIASELHFCDLRACHLGLNLKLYLTTGAQRKDLYTFVIAK